MIESQPSPILVGEGQALAVESLQDFFARTPRFALAFSGGCDSAYLLAAALKAGCDVKAYGVKTAFQPNFEIEDSLQLTDALHAPFQLIDVDIFTHPQVCANDNLRCYYCKTVIFETILEAARKDGFEVLADGTNATDNPARRPGFQALRELGITSPLRRAGLTKDEIRAASANLGLFTAQKPSFSCLAVHSPAHKLLTPELLAQTQTALIAQGIIR